jgi:queuine tRNA-ribosyltransferase
VAFRFTLQTTDGRARRGRLQTPYGDVETPIFMPVGTAGTVKALAPDDLVAAGTQVLLANTYHLLLRPGPERVSALGGLHAMMAWPRPILTDSGGFQVFSHAGGDKPLAKIDDDGVTFRSHLDGSTRRITAEESMRVQMLLGADIVMAFDECPPGSAPKDVVVRAMQRTSRWLGRSVLAMTREQSRLFGIVQGGVHDDLRAEHAQELSSTHDLFGWAIGGLSVGEGKEDMLRALGTTTAHLPADKPRYLMGVGTPEDLLDGMARGVDMFDCVMPTRNARNATLFTSTGKLSIKGARFAADEGPLDAACRCYTCRTFSRAYLRHLWNARELLFFRLASLHNVTFYLDLMARARQAIEERRFEAFARCEKEKWAPLDAS